MGNRVSRAVAGCFVAPSEGGDAYNYGGGGAAGGGGGVVGGVFRRSQNNRHSERAATYYLGGGAGSELPDEGLGHSFCYVRPPPTEAGHLSPSTSHSDRFAPPFAAAAAATNSSSSNPDPNSSSFRLASATAAAPSTSSAAAFTFKSISGASVSANTSTPRTLIRHQQFHSFANVPDDRHAAFESTSSFASLPLQPVPRGVSLSGPISAPESGPLQDTLFLPDEHLHQRGFISGPLERGFMSGPIERGFMSGPLERGFMSGPYDSSISTDHTHFSAPLAGSYHLWRTRRRRKITRLLASVQKPIRGVLTRTISSTLTLTRRSLVAPVRHFVWRHRHNGSKEESMPYETQSDLRFACSCSDHAENHNLQWAQGKAGEDRVHVVVSEDNGWLFVGIYDGFNGPDAPDFLMSNLYKAVYKELQELLWIPQEVSDRNNSSRDESKDASSNFSRGVESNVNMERFEPVNVYSDVWTPSGEAKRGLLTRSRTLRELLADADADADANNKPNSSKIKHKSHESYHLFCETLTRVNSEPSCLRLGKPDDEMCRSNNNLGGKMVNGCKANFDNGIRAVAMKPERVSTIWAENSSVGPHCINKKVRNQDMNEKFSPERNDPSIQETELAKQEDLNEGELNLWGHGAVDHDAVLKGLARALELTEEAYLAMADRAMEENPELALMGSCILVALMKDKDVYVLNVGDSRAILAQKKNEHHSISSFNSDAIKRGGGGRDVMNRQDLERISEESPIANGGVSGFASVLGPPLFSSSLTALQLSTDHSTNIQEEVCRIKAEHPDDTMCVFNGRVKGRLKVTRAFGAGFLKKSRWNSAILKMFQIEYIGSDPYISCTPSLHHHKLEPNDRFLVLSSDGLYQYFTNQEVVSHVEWFLEKFPEGDPAQYLIEELLFRAAKKAGKEM